MADPIRSAPRRIDAWLSAVLFLTGSVAFLAAGRMHPQIGTALGPVGSEAFFHAFAHQVMRLPGWEAIHAGILVGPIFWGLGASDLPRQLPGRVAGLANLARTALLLTAALWSVAFVLDGFVAPMYARVITTATEPTDVRAALLTFHASQRTMARLGTVSVALLGGAALALAVALLTGARTASVRTAVGAAGVLVGLWPLVATATGEFTPGPFTSAYWMPTALLLGVWFAAFALTLPMRTPSPSPDETKTRVTATVGQAMLTVPGS